MNASSPTSTPELAMLAIKCPSWCTTSPEIHAEELEEGGPSWVQHDAEPIGCVDIRTSIEHPGELIAYVDQHRQDAYSSVELRQLAADCLAAAEWMEAQR